MVDLSLGVASLAAGVLLLLAGVQVLGPWAFLAAPGLLIGTLLGLLLFE